MCTCASAGQSTHRAGRTRHVQHGVKHDELSQHGMCSPCHAGKQCSHRCQPAQPSLAPWRTALLQHDRVRTMCMQHMEGLCACCPSSVTLFWLAALSPTLLLLLSCRWLNSSVSMDRSSMSGMPARLTDCPLSRLQSTCSRGCS
jgi:hypothetical protein